MSKKSFLTKIMKRLKIGNHPMPPMITPEDDAAVMEKLLKMVENTDEIELGCEEVLDLLDQYVELEARGEDVAHLLPLVKKHLDRCRDCFEEYEALMRIISANT